MPQVAITDYTFPSLEIEQAILDEAGLDLISGQCRTPETLMELVRDADAVITQFAPVNADVVRGMQRAKVIVRYGIGYDNVACDVARELGIPVCNIPDYCVDEVAEHTLACILATTRQLRPNCDIILRGKWGLGVPLEHMRTLRDLTVGIIGFGRIGRAVAERLKAFRCRMLVVDPVASSSDVAAAGASLVPLDDLLTSSDVVTLHCPSTPQTRKLINADTLARMKPGAIFINLGRGDLADLDSVTQALSSGHLSAAALDVFDPEPLPAGHPLRELSNVILSSHIASASPTAVRTLRETAARLAVMALRGEPLPTVVNGVGAGTAS
jgi:D-3-phosphoglycerate dehydrogenase